MGKKNSPGCNCCCKDVCRIRESIASVDSFSNGINSQYEQNGTHRFDVGPVTGMDGSALRLHASDEGSCYLRIPAGALQGRRIKITCDVRPYAGPRTDSFTQRYGVFVGNAFSVMLEVFVDSGTPTSGSNYKIYSGVGDFGEGGIEEFSQTSLFNDGNLAIEINYDGLTPNVYSVGIGWTKGPAKYFQVPINFTNDEIKIGYRGELGGAWDRACIVYNHNAGTCFPCMGCKQQPKEQFPIKWLLSFPALDQTNAPCDNCDIFAGDHELVYMRVIDRALSTDYKGCAWVTLAQGKACSISTYVGNLWQLSDRLGYSELEATNRTNYLGYRCDNFKCDQPNTFYFYCLAHACDFFVDGEYVPACNHPDTLTITPVFST